MENKWNEINKEKVQKLNEEVEIDNKHTIYSNILELIDEKSISELLSLFGDSISKIYTNKEQNSNVSSLVEEGISTLNASNIEYEKSNKFICEHTDYMRASVDGSPSFKFQKIKNENSVSENLNFESTDAPFKSPITTKTVNLRSKFNTLKSKNKSSSNQTDENIIDETNSLGEVFGDENEEPRKYKRKSSVLAEINTIKKIEKEILDSQKEEYIKRPFDLLFCGISKDSAASTKVFNLNKPKEMNSPIKLGVLFDRTNSPVKPFKSFTSEKVENTKPVDLNPAFFISDDIIENKKDDILWENNEREATISKNYVKTRQINTKLNEGYSTVATKRKVVIDLFTCPKTFYRKNDRERKVYFNLDPVLTVHNSQNMLNSILVETKNDEYQFEWNKEKEVVEIVKRIDLGSEVVVEDFLFRKVDESIES